MTADVNADLQKISFLNFFRLPESVRWCYRHSSQTGILSVSGSNKEQHLTTYDQNMTKTKSQKNKYDLRIERAWIIVAMGRPTQTRTSQSIHTAYTSVLIVIGEWKSNDNRQ